MSAIRNEIQLLKKSLEKAISSDSPIDSEVLDILLALKKLPMTIEILRETKIGNIVYEAKKKYPSSNRCHNESKDIIALWKKCAVSKAVTEIKSPVGSVVKAETMLTNIKVPEDSAAEELSPRAKLENEEEAEEDFEQEKIYDAMAQTRKKIMDLFTQHLSLSTTKTNISKILAFNIESSINALHCSYGDSKEYVALARSLSFNLKRNERLRFAILEGVLAPEDLVKLSPNELATDEQKDARDAESKASTLERRADYYQIARAGIQRANGIDPEAGGEYTCRKCKGNKTTHYAMQTRSADEPMTVFVGCLTCGNRWRCT